MAFFDCHFFSDVLGLSVSVYVLLPQRANRQIGLAGGGEGVPSAGYPVLTLLHGLSDDHTIWMRRTAIERYAAERGIAVVMPAVGRSFYQDMASGARYWTFISEELPAAMREFFPISNARESNFVAGLSMGGYGALRLALTYPDRYAAAASFSGALDIARRCKQAGRKGSLLSREELQAMFGEGLDIENTGSDLFHLSKEIGKTQEKRPALYLSCGTEDSLIAENRAFQKHLQRLGVEATCAERKAAHDWAFWDAEIQRTLAWLPLPKR